MGTRNVRTYCPAVTSGPLRSGVQQAGLQVTLCAAGLVLYYGPLRLTTLSASCSTFWGPASGFAWNPGVSWDIGLPVPTLGSPRQARPVGHPACTIHHRTGTCHRSITDRQPAWRGGAVPLWTAAGLLKSALDVLFIAQRPYFYWREAFVFISFRLAEIQASSLDIYGGGGLTPGFAYKSQTGQQSVELTPSVGWDHGRGHRKHTRLGMSRTG